MSKIQSSMTLTSSGSEELFQISEKLVGAMLGKNNSQAYVVLHCEKGQEYTTLKNICKISEVKEADVVFGLYDIVCRVESSSEEVLQDIVTRTIRRLPSIKTSMTLNIIKEQEP
jgi:DNA-binding Lrp family transcriptional regulator